MPSHHAPRKCFAALYYYIGEAAVYILFTEGEQYRYPEFSLDAWNALKSAAHAGSFFNSNQRRPSRISKPYSLFTELPANPDDEILFG